jgi:hypothetical protein
MFGDCAWGVGCGMGWGMGLFGLLTIVALVLAIAALIKYLGPSKS